MAYAGVLFLTGCSFVKPENSSPDAPKFVFENMHIVRYTDKVPKFAVDAELMESFPAKEIFAAKNIYLVSYTDSSTADNLQPELKASAGQALLLQKQHQYFLGDSVFIRSEKDDVTISAENLFYNEDAHILYGAENETVRLQRGDGSFLTGKNFSANAVSKQYEFTEAVSGKIEQQETEETKERSDDTQ